MSTSTSFTHIPGTGPTTSIIEFAPKSASLLDFYRITPSVPNTSELLSAQVVLGQLSKLKEDWDGYGALAVASDACAHAQRFIAFSPQGMLVPEVSPTSNGTVSLEWVSNEGDAYLEVGRTRYSGHIQSRGKTIYLQGQLATLVDQNLATEQVLAVIKQLLYGASFSKSATHSIPIHEPVL
jgi:hypothetical protein